MKIGCKCYDNLHSRLDCDPAGTMLQHSTHDTCAAEWSGRQSGGTQEEAKTSRAKREHEPQYTINTSGSRSGGSTCSNRAARIVNRWRFETRAT